MNSSIEQAKPIIMKRALQVVLPLALSISLLISCYPSSLNSLINAIDLSHVSQVINRKACLLILNAILLFVARDSGLLAPSVSGLYDELVAMKGSDARPPKAGVDELKASGGVAVEERAAGENIVRPLEVVAVEEENEELELLVVESDEGTEEEGLGVDELNRRCEEFIEKIKRERKLEARQLVMV